MRAPGFGGATLGATGPYVSIAPSCASSPAVSSRSLAITWTQRASMYVTPAHALRAFISALARRAALSAARPGRTSTRAPDRAGSLRLQRGCDPRDRWPCVGLKCRAGHELVARDVAASGLDADLVGHHGRRTIARPLCLARKPAPHELLVEAARLLATSEPLLVVLGVPVARRVGRMDLVDHDDRTRSVDPHLVLGVGEDQALLRRVRAARGEQRLGDRRRSLEVCRRDPTHREQLVFAHRHVVIALGGLRRRREDRLRQRLVLAHAVRQRVAAERARTLLV